MAVTKTESQTSSLDKLKFVISLVLVVVAIAGFYYFSQESTLYRVLGLLFIFLMAVGVFYTTQAGRNLVGFMGDARTEVRKMVWPSRIETMQTTGIVIFIVALLAIFLFFIDSILAWAMKLFLSMGA